MVRLDLAASAAGSSVGVSHSSLATDAVLVKITAANGWAFCKT